MFRIGLGYDVHPLTPGSPLIIGGVTIPHTHRLVGHSDADVLAHAIADAVLGAAALGDIGHHFPPSDPQYRGANSIELLRQAVSKIHQAGYRVGNVDSVLICERPKIAPHIKAMQSCLAEALRVDATQVSIKATTTERLGFEGREEGIAAQAIALLLPSA